MTCKIRPLALHIGLALSMAAGSTASFAVVTPDNDAPPSNIAASQPDADGRLRYIVLLEQLPAALYDGSDFQFAAIPRVARRASTATATATGRRIDFRSAQAEAYVQHLATEQTTLLNAMEQRIVRRLTPVFALQHALNALVLDLTPKEAEAIRSLPKVLSVAPDQTRQLATEYSTALIGAQGVRQTGPDDAVFIDGFDGGPSLSSPDQGEGSVLGVLDTGINPASASFAAVDESGYHHTNPLGAGTYLGMCAPGQPLAGRCNDKLIGIYDTTAKPQGLDGVGHGSHTASTAAGNRRKAKYFGLDTLVTGVAPHANIIAYRVCESTSCADSAIAAAADQAVRDGIVDSINFSISGGFMPWSEATSLAFLSATNAGIFVAAAAGNTNQYVAEALEGTVNHQEPWVTTVAATTSNHGAAAVSLQATGGTTALPGFAVQMPSGVTDPVPASVPQLPLAISPTYGVVGDGCTAFAAQLFQGKTALLKASSDNDNCAASVMIDNARNAGAGVVLIASQYGGLFGNFSVADNVLAFDLKGADAAVLKQYGEANPGALVQISAAAGRSTAEPDHMAYFSLRGPAAYGFGKPDLAMPGVEILAAYKDESGTHPDGVAFMSGTSMATPHAAGAGLLLRTKHPDWTPLEIKSALMMTAKEDGVLESASSAPADSNARGSGRAQVPAAASAGLVLDETSAHFAAANPYPTSPSVAAGDPSMLNLAQIAIPSCVTVDQAAGTSTKRCSVSREFRSTQSRSVTWTPSVVGSVDGGVQFNPAQLTVAGGARQRLTVTFDSRTWTGPQAATLVLTPDDASLPKLHLPIAVDLPAQDISATPKRLDVAAASNQVTRASLKIANSGGADLVVNNTSLADGSTYAASLIDQKPYLGTGLIAMYAAPYSFFSTPIPLQSFVVDAPEPLAKIETYLMRAKGLLSTLGTPQKVNYWIVPDVDGQPANPLQTPASALWANEIKEGSSGLSIVGNNVFAIETLDFTASGAVAGPTLPPGKYWLGMARDGNNLLAMFGFSDSTLWRPTPTGNGTTPFTMSNTTVSADGEAAGVALRIDQKVTCNATPAWLSVDPAFTSITIPGGLVGSYAKSIDVLVDPSKFPDGQTIATGSLCLQSNDPSNPVYRVVVHATRS